jgi:hypothetical protein
MTSIFETQSVANARSDCLILELYSKVMANRTIVMDCNEMGECRQLQHS